MTLTSGQDLILPDTMMTRHCLAVASTGTGKSNFLNLILKQQMMRGGGVLHIDGKNNNDAIREFLTLARQHDRWQDVRIININDAKLSNTYNPLLRGDSEAMVNRIMLMIPQGGESYFRSAASNSVRAIIGLVKKMDLPFNFADLMELFSQKGLRWLMTNAPKDSREYQDFIRYTEFMMSTDKRTGQKDFDEKKFQHAFGDLQGKCSSYGMGVEVRDVLNAYNPEVDLFQAMQENLLVYVGLPMLEKAEAATDFAKLMLSDLLTAVGQLQNNRAARPNPTFLVLMDEFASYAIPSLDTLFQQARSANICLFPFVQTVASLTNKDKGLSEEFKGSILGNTWTKIVMQLTEPESREDMSKVAGEALKQQKSVSFSENLSFAKGSEDASMLAATGRGRGMSESISMQYEAIIRPEDFGNLDLGEAFVISKLGTFKVRIPEVVLSKDDEGLDFPRFRMPARQGLNVAERLRGSGARPQAPANPADTGA